MDKTTVIIKTIGRPSLKAAIRSAKREGFKVIVVSDGAKVSAQGATKLVKLGKNWGYYGGMAANVGAAMADTEYVTFLDDDDVFIEGAGDIIRAKLEEDPTVDVWIGGARFSKEIAIWDQNVNPPELLYSGYDLACSKERGIKVGNISLPTVRTEVFKNVPYADNLPEGHEGMADYYWTKACTNQGFKVDWFESVIYIVRPQDADKEDESAVNGRGKVI